MCSKVCSLFSGNTRSISVFSRGLTHISYPCHVQSLFGLSQSRSFSSLENENKLHVYNLFSCSGWVFLTQENISVLPTARMNDQCM